MQMLCSGTWRHPQRRSGQVGGEGLGTEKATQTVGRLRVRWPITEVVGTGSVGVGSLKHLKSL